MSPPNAEKIVEDRYINNFRQHVLPNFPLMSESTVTEIMMEPGTSKRKNILGGFMKAIGKSVQLIPGEQEQPHCWERLKLAELDTISDIQGHLLLAIYFLYLGQTKKLDQCMAIRELIMKELRLGTENKLPELAPLYWVCMRIDM